MARALFIAAFFFTMTPLLILIQWLLGKLGLPGWGFIATGYYRLLCSLLRIRVRVSGVPVRNRAVLFVSNHVSWADILVIGSLAPVAFVAKHEVRDWPLVGITAKLQRTVFVDRTRRHQTGNAVAEIVKRIESGVSVVLFAEGTSSDGNRVLTFRTALIGAASDTVTDVVDVKRVWIQPLSIAYTALRGLPLGRPNRSTVAWYGSMSLLPHLRRLVAQGAIDVIVSWGEPVPYDPSSDRKVVARRLEECVRAMTVASLRGRDRSHPIRVGQDSL